MVLPHIGMNQPHMGIHVLSSLNGSSIPLVVYGIKSLIEKGSLIHSVIRNVPGTVLGI